MLSEIDLKKLGIDPERLPRHIAIIMDGNGRWAKKGMMPRIFGHREGVKTVDRIVTFARKAGISALTLYSFSSENWLRPKEEVSALMGILNEYIKKELARMLKEDIRFNTIGRIDHLPRATQNLINDAKEKTRDNNGLILTLALSYGSRQEILEVVKRVAHLAKSGEIGEGDIDERLFESFLYTEGLPTVDLLIRTSGEIRISNFLLWQIAYSEIYFTDTLWPDFKEDDLVEAIIEYQNRERRFGMTTEQLRNKKEN